MGRVAGAPNARSPAGPAAFVSTSDFHDDGADPAVGGPDLDEASFEDFVGRSLDEVQAAQRALVEGFERLARVVSPLLTAQYESTQTRVRALEQRVLQRQERPTIVQIARLLSGGHRLRSARDVAEHLLVGLQQILEGLGYELFGAVGDPLDEILHEAVGGEECERPVVTVLHERGLRAGDDVVIRARVETGPAEPDEDFWNSQRKDSQT